MMRVSLTSEIAGIVGGSVQAIAGDAELGDVERSKVELEGVLHVDTLLMLLTGAVV
jgi:hypothetical protein